MPSTQPEPLPQGQRLRPRPSGGGHRDAQASPRIPCIGKDALSEGCCNLTAFGNVHNVVLKLVDVAISRPSASLSEGCCNLTAFGNVHNVVLKLVDVAISRPSASLSEGCCNRTAFGNVHYVGLSAAAATGRGLSQPSLQTAEAPHGVRLSVAKFISSFAYIGVYCCCAYAARAHAALTSTLRRISMIADCCNFSDTAAVGGRAVNDSWWCNWGRIGCRSQRPSREGSQSPVLQMHHPFDVPLAGDGCWWRNRGFAAWLPPSSALAMGRQPAVMHTHLFHRSCSTASSVTHGISRDHTGKGWCQAVEVFLFVNGVTPSKWHRGDGQGARPESISTCCCLRGMVGWAVSYSRVDSEVPSLPCRNQIYFRAFGNNMMCTLAEIASCCCSVQSASSAFAFTTTYRPGSALLPCSCCRTSQCLVHGDICSVSALESSPAWIKLVAMFVLMQSATPACVYLLGQVGSAVPPRHLCHRKGPTGVRGRAWHATPAEGGAALLGRGSTTARLHVGCRTRHIGTARLVGRARLPLRPCRDCGPSRSHPSPLDRASAGFLVTHSTTTCHPDDPQHHRSGSCLGILCQVKARRIPSLEGDQGPFVDVHRGHCRRRDQEYEHLRRPDSDRERVCTTVGSFTQCLCSRGRPLSSLHPSSLSLSVCSVRRGDDARATPSTDGREKYAKGRPRRRNTYEKGEGGRRTLDGRKNRITIWAKAVRQRVGGGGDWAGGPRADDDLLMLLDPHDPPPSLPLPSLPPQQRAQHG